MPPEIIIPTLFGCALLWWIGRDMQPAVRLAVAVVTLALVGAVLLVERFIR